MIPNERGIDIELADPKYARTEFERRWLVDITARPPVEGLPATLVEDRYIVDTRLRLRRMSRCDTGEVVWKLTKKYECEHASLRPIVTAYLAEREYEVFRRLPANQLTKRRYRLEFDGRWWSVDVFDGALAGLTLIECEASDRDTLSKLVPPYWAGREITDEPHWQGGALAAGQAIPEK